MFLRTLLSAVLAVVACTPAAAQSPRLDARLVVGPYSAPFQGPVTLDVVTRPRWHYPAAGAAVGAAAGLAHGYAITHGDNIGWPVDPRHFLPVAYGAVGAFLGLLVDHSERERKAARR
jgi:hypothetical protein